LLDGVAVVGRASRPLPPQIAWDPPPRSLLDRKVGLSIIHLQVFFGTMDTVVQFRALTGSRARAVGALSGRRERARWTRATAGRSPAAAPSCTWTAASARASRRAGRRSAEDHRS